MGLSIKCGQIGGDIGRAAAYLSVKTYKILCSPYRQKMDGGQTDV